MARDHDSRSKRTMELTVEDQRAEQLKRAFESAGTIINHRQALAIANLTLTGAQSGRDMADPIPRSVAIVGVGKRQDDPMWDATGGDDAADGVGRQFQALGLLAEDGRTWSVTGGGACWPGGTSLKDARRGA
jgi:hypothetical protein